MRKWNYVWDLFFHEPELAGAIQGADGSRTSKTNKKIAILARQRSGRPGCRRQDLAGARQGVRL